MVIYTDTSDYGCINSKETIVMYNSVASFESFFNESHLLIRSDNTAAIAFAHDMGGMFSPLRDHWVCQLWKRAEKAGYWISVAHIAEADNFQAGFASRVFNDRTEWALPQYTFDKLMHQFGCPTLDLFATQLNRKLKRYVPWVS